MAQKKPIKKSASKKITPEVVYVAKPKKPVATKKPIKKTAKKSHKKPLLLKRVNKHLFYSIIFIVGVVVTLFVWVYVATQVNKATVVFDAAEAVARNSGVNRSSDLQTVRVVGSDEKLKSEIINLQSAPPDLQAYILKDYRLFKQTCVVNGQLIDTASYELEGVVYDTFAKIRRECNGSDSLILKKFDSGWSVIFTGNAYPECSLVNDLNVPKGMAYNCTQNGVTYINANP